MITSKIIKITGFIFFTPVFSYVGLFLFDIFTAPPTTVYAVEKAELYVVENNVDLPLHSFRTDGCTAWPDRIADHDFSQACLNHDIAYWAGGDEALKTRADEALMEEVAVMSTLGAVIYGPLMYSAVKYGGDNAISILIGSKWGYGNIEPEIKPLYIGTNINF